MIYIHNDRLCNTAINRDQQTWYRYDAGGNRARKISQIGPNLLKERIYFTNFEIYRERSMDGEVITERHTNHIADGSKRIAMVDSLTIDHGQSIEPVTTIRYQYDNHLGSACLELDERANIISYEEYHPFGTTSYRSGRSLTETSLKRYKYVGKERDEETGLYYYGARYYAAWLCRFVSVDPIQFDYPELTPYQYASNRPVTGIDMDGLEFYSPSEVRIKVLNNEVHINLNNFNESTRNKWNLRNRNQSAPNGEIGWSTKYADVAYPGVPLDRTTASLDKSYSPYVDASMNPAVIKKVGYTNNGTIDNRVKASIGTPSPKVKGLAGFALALNAINLGIDTYGSFKTLDDKQKVEEHFKTFSQDIFKIITKSLENDEYIPTKYRNSKDLLAISSVILAGVNPTENDEIYEIGIKIVKEIAKNYKPKLEVLTLPLNENSDNTAVKKQIIVQANVEMTNEQIESLTKWFQKSK